jgi:hypothetical protein
MEEVEGRAAGIESLRAARVRQVMVVQAEMQPENVDPGRQMRRVKLLAREQDLVAGDEALVELRRCIELSASAGRKPTTRRRHSDYSGRQRLDHAAGRAIERLAREPFRFWLTAGRTCDRTK